VAYQWGIALFLFFCEAIHSSAIVFVHIGKSLPSYMETTLTQAQLFNPHSEIYMIGSHQALGKLHVPVNKIAYETLEKSQEHLEFLARRSDDGYWRYVVERFFYLDELLMKYQLDQVLHLENDVMVYFDFDALIPSFERCYAGIGATFISDALCILGIVYIANRDRLHAVLPFIVEMTGRGMNDMEIFAAIRREQSRDVIDDLPIIPLSYLEEAHKLGERLPNVSDPDRYCAYTEVFNSIFDAAALGQYLGGVDPIFGSPMPGYINYNSIFDPRRFQYTWEIDGEGRKIPYIHHAGRKYRINNLHIHSKRLENFKS
jgi:hypothetical protein